MRRAANGLVALAALAALLAGTTTACGSDTPTATFGATGAWSRPTPPGATDGVIYLTVTSDVADELTGVEVPADVAASAGLHATAVGGAGGPHHGGGGGATGTVGDDVVSMVDVDTFPIAAGDAVVFEPGGNHVMLEDLTRPLVRGEHYTATLRFTSGRSLTVDVVVADNPPG